MPLTSIVYPAPPPTNNTLDPEQRTRLLRSTRKLEAVLGATPHLVDPECDRDGDAAVFPSPSAKQHSAHSRSHLNPNHHAHRLYASPSASSSVSSVDSSAEQDYVFVKGGPGAHSAPYQVVPLHSRSSSPGSSRSASPANSFHREMSILGKKNAQGLAMPMTVAVDIPLSSEKKKAKAGPQALAQPMLLRLRALPTDSRHTPNSSISSTFSSNSATSSTTQSTVRTARPAIPTFPSQDSLALPAQSSSSRREGKVDSVLGPLSPLIASLTLAGDDGPPRSPTTPTAAYHSRSMSMTTPSRTPILSDKDKRRKMAKLQRTLGENIPVELVFKSIAPASAAPTTKPSKSSSRPTRVIRRSSLSAVPFFGANPNPVASTSNGSRPLPVPPTSHYQRTTPHKLTKSLFEGGIGVGSTLPVAEVPIPPSAPHPASENAHTSTSQSTSKHRKPRPRSLTLGTSSAFVRANQKLAQREVQEATGRGFGTTSLDSGSRPLGSGVPFARLEKTQQQPRGLGLVPPFDTIGMGSSGRKEKERKQKKEEKKGRKSGEDKRPEAREHDQDWEGRRKEKEWSGEWNVKDMEVVARQLRNLKV
ncbi:hypothetical protein CPB83DRAFT_613127 [Crepidotus variabilis]|uniref:Uncharacterized protein n=1 Tax=Crepidotus variabilis TaxID=179855 RepID=A0A9P6E8T4_9AGAR|nr:hypothetical protein CPB83DRAFT_613127 [Crepidotus variabilis]